MTLTCTRYSTYDDCHTARTFEEGSVAASGVARCGVHLLSKKKGCHAKTYRATTKRALQKENACPLILPYS